jgi:hypothetical protein
MNQLKLSLANVFFFFFSFILFTNKAVLRVAEHES